MIGAMITGLLFLVVVIVAVVLWTVCKPERDYSLSAAFFTIGLSLISGAFAGKFDTIINFLSSVFKIQFQIEDSTNWGQLATGILLIILGLITQKSINNRIYILNMLGIMRKEISGTPEQQKLGLKGYQVKEIILDTMWAQEGIESITDTTWEKAKKQIQYYVESFSAKDDVKCFTGMAPIPFEMYAGACGKGQHVQRFFEYVRKDDTYTELHTGRKGKKYDELIVPLVNNIKATDVVVVISITSEISNQALSQFEGMPQYIVRINDPHDNAITSRYQLRNYVKVIGDLLEKVSQRGSGTICIHLVCAAQSCLVYALGEELVHIQNRVGEVISYHYKSSFTVKYPIGIVVNGGRKGDLVKVGISST